MAKTLTCTNHCSKCNSHFHSEAAFSAHRRGKFAPKKGERGRYCVAPEDAAAPDGSDLFLALTTDGVCNLTGGAMQRHVTIWTLRESYERGKVAFKRMKEQKPKRRRRRRRW